MLTATRRIIVYGLSRGEYLLESLGHRPNHVVKKPIEHNMHGYRRGRIR